MVRKPEQPLPIGALGLMGEPGLKTLFTVPEQNPPLS
jgi:hypothetical protein